MAMNPAMIAKPPTMPPAMIPGETGEGSLDVVVVDGEVLWTLCMIAGVLIGAEGVTEDGPPEITGGKSTLVT